MMHPDDLKLVREYFAGFDDAGDDEVRTVEYRAKNKMDRWVWLRARGRVFQRDENGKPTHCVNVLQNITEYKAAVAALVESEKLATTGEMARMIAHEVRNPLTSVNLAIDMLRTKLKGNAKLISYTDIIMRNNTRINTLIRDLLSASKPIENTMAVVPLAELVNEAATLVKDRIKLADKKVIIENDADCKVQVNPESVRIALLNIILNAVEAIQPKTGVVKIKTWVKDGHCNIAINDNGAGIDESVLINLFDPFHTTKNAGIGLGLTNARTFIKNNNGTIQAQSKLGEGSTFTVSFPVARE
jgi:signal transduction histidine kinase